MHELMDEKFQKYLQFGGMPILREYKFNETRTNQALEGIYSTVVLRDIQQRDSGTDQTTLQKIMLFLCSSIGSITSPNSIGNVLSKEGDIQTGKQKTSQEKQWSNTFPCSAMRLYSFLSVGTM